MSTMKRISFEELKAMPPLSEEEKKQRYVEFYDMCDVYKSETIPESEVGHLYHF